MKRNKSTHKKDVTLYSIDQQKFLAKIAKAASNECWNWNGAKNTRGYGLHAARTLPDEYERTGRTYTQVLAHRVAYYMHYGALNPSDYVCHTCDNPSCCNPNHLWRGSQQDNVDDMILKGRACWQK